jgi:medium-chain acyl-[acyl-carrier-protein] hydrolase
MTTRTGVGITAGGSPVDCPRPLAEAPLRLVAFSHAGGGPAAFHSWTDALAPGVELWRVTLPGRAGRRREPFAREWLPLVDDLGAAVARAVPPPVALFGHSLGALLAFEVGRWLTEACVPPVRLIVSGRAAPDVPVTVDLPAADEDLVREASALAGGVPDSVLACPEALALFLPILRADLQLANAYALRSRVVLPCPITAMAGDADPIAPPSTLPGWAVHTSAGYEACMLPGGHFFLVEQEQVMVPMIRSRLLG